MKKKIFLMLPCIAAVAIATFVGKKTFESHAYDKYALLTANVEALSNKEFDGVRFKCYTDFVYEVGSSAIECSTCRILPNHTAAMYSTPQYCN